MSKHFKKTGNILDARQINSVHDSLDLLVAYKDIMATLTILEKSLTTDVEKKMYKRHGLKFVIPIEIDFEIGSTLDTVQDWNYDLKELKRIVKDTLIVQKKLLKHPINKSKRKEIMSLIFDSQESIKHMPKWLQHQRKENVKHS